MSSIVIPKNPFSNSNSLASNLGDSFFIEKDSRMKQFQNPDKPLRSKDKLIDRAPIDEHDPYDPNTYYCAYIKKGNEIGPNMTELQIKQ